MAKFHLTIGCDNDAFMRDAAGEIGRILAALGQDIADKGAIFNRGASGNTHDINGNTCGAWAYDARPWRNPRRKAPAMKPTPPVDGMDGTPLNGEG